MTIRFTTQQITEKKGGYRKGYFMKCITFFCLFCLFFSNKGISQGTWVPVGLPAPHANEGVMILLTDGTVLCKTSSGGTGYGDTWDRLTPDNTGSYVNGTWTTIAPMHDERLYFSTQVLRDGRVYVAGGEYGSGGFKGEVYDPLTNVWTPVPQLVFTGTAPNNGISDANSEILPDGTVLQALVDTGSTKLNFVWNPATNTYTKTGSCLRVDNEAPWVKLPDNSILFMDGYSTSSERYIPAATPAAGTWINDGTLAGGSLFDPFGEEAGGAYLLPNGKVFFIGSTPKSAYYTPSGTASPGTWAAGPVLPLNEGAPDAASAMMVNGKILLALSPTPVSGEVFFDTTNFYQFDYTTNTFTSLTLPMGGSPGDTVVAPSFETNMLVMPDGRILFAFQFDNQYYEYIPDSGPLAAGKPTISNIIENTCTNFTITGTLFNGISEGACYGDDWQNVTNYPIVRLTSGTNVYYARTTNWNSTGVMRGTALDTATFTLPAGIPTPGTYNVQVVTNGNPSANYSLTIGPATITSANICPGGTTTLSTSVSGGTWTSGTTTVATIGSSSGNVTGVSGGSSTITYALGTCTSTSTVTVNTLSSITPAGAINICAGANTGLTDATGGGVWSSTNTSVASVSGAGLVTALTAGTATISYTKSGCAVASAVTVNPLPASITGPSSICSGTTGQFSDAGFSSGVWTSSNTSVVTIGAVTGLATAGGLLSTANIVYMLPTGCSASTTVSVSLSAAPITGTTSICSGTSSGLTDAFTGGAWVSSNTTIATVGTSGVVNGVSPGSAAITYTLGSGCLTTTPVTVNLAPVAISGASNVCVGSTVPLSDGVIGGNWSTANTNISLSLAGNVTGISAGFATITYALGSCQVTTVETINAIPSSITGPTAVCTGQTANLSDASSGGIWSSNNTSIVTVISGTLTGVTTGTATISYTLGGCSVISPITVFQTPAAITGSPSLCIGLTTSLTDATTGGAWTTSSSSVATVDGVGTVTGSSAGTATISYTDISSGCVASDVVTVHLLPSAISGFTTFCSGATTMLSDAVSGGTWSSSNTTVATAGSAGVISGASIGTASIIYTLGAGCTASTTVSVISGPSPISGVPTTCPGFTTPLSDGIPGGTWESSNTVIATVSTSGTVTGVATGTSTITYSLSSGCAVTDVVTIGATTAAPITGTTSVCIGQTTPLTDATTGGTWSSSSTAKATVGASSGIVTGVSAGTAVITYKVTNPCGTATTTTTVTINSLPVVSAISGSTNVCVTGTTPLTDATATGVWSSGNTSIATVSTVGLVSGITTGTVPVSYTVTNLSGCSASAVASVSVNAPITPTITPASSTTFCTGGFVMLNATTGTGYTYQWQVGSTNIPGATSSGYLANSGGTYDVVINGPGICTSTSGGVAVTVNPSSIVVPSVSVTASPGTLLCLVSSPVTFTPSPHNGGGAPTYQWYVNGAFAAGSTAYSYSPANGDVVKCVLTSSDACAFPDTAVSSVLMTISAAQTPSVSIGVTPSDTVCAGTLTTFFPVPVYGGSAPAYSWTKNGVSVPAGATYAYTPSNGDIIVCTMVSNYTCLATATATSKPFRINVEQPMANTVTVLVTRSSLASGQADTFVAIAPNAGTSPAYQWYVNGVPVAGQTAAIFITSTLANGDIVKCAVTSSNECASPNTGFSTGIKIAVHGVWVAQVGSASGSFALEPNPNNGTFIITGSVKNAADEAVNIVVTDMLGQVVYKRATFAKNGAVEEHIVLAHTLANGMYLVSITSGDDRAVFHIVVNN